MAVLQSGKKVLGRAFGNQQRQQQQPNLGSGDDAIQALIANQKAGVSLEGSPSVGRKPSGKQAKFEVALSSPTTYEVKNAERSLEAEDGKQTSLEALEQQGYVIPENIQKHYAGGEPTGESVTKDGRIINIDRDNIQEHTVVRTNEDGTTDTRVIKSYGYKRKQDVFGNRQSIMREAALDMASKAGFSQEQAEQWFSKNWDKYTDGAAGGESHTWRALIKNVQVKDINEGTLQEFFTGPGANNYSPRQGYDALINSYNQAYVTVRTQAPKVVEGKRGTGDTVATKVQTGDALDESKEAMSPDNVLRKRSNKLLGTDRFIIAENIGEATKNLKSEGLKLNLNHYTDTEGGKVVGTAFNMANTYLHLHDKGMLGPLVATNSEDQNKAFDTLVELGVIQNFNPEDSREGRQMLQDSVALFNEHILPRATAYAGGLTETERDTLQMWHRNPANVALRNKYAQLHARKELLKDNFLTDTDIGRELMLNSDGLFNTDSIQTLDSDVPFNPQNPYSIDTLVDTLASLPSKQERQRFIHQNLKDSLTPKGQRWMNRVSNNLSLVLKNVDDSINYLGSNLGRRPVSKPLSAEPSFGNKVAMFFTDDTRDVRYSKANDAWVGNPDSDDYNVVSGLDALEKHWAQVESLNFKQNNIEVSKVDFITTVTNKARNSETFKEKLQRRLNLTDNQITVLIDTIPDLTEFELDRELENILSIRQQPDPEEENETVQVKDNKPTGKNVFPGVDKSRLERIMPEVLQSKE